MEGLIKVITDILIRIATRKKKLSGKLQKNADKPKIGF